MKVLSRTHLLQGWVIANHILVSFHVAFISSVLVLPSISLFKGEVLKFIFISPETIVSALFMYISFHSGIALHEMGHFLTAAKLNALNDRAQKAADIILHGSAGKRSLALIKIFFTAPFGKAAGIRREGLSYYPDAPYNLAVAAAGPRMSRNVALVTLLPAVCVIFIGLGMHAVPAIYAGRLLLGIGIVSLLDFLMADPGKYREFRLREKRARLKAQSIPRSGKWWEDSIDVKKHMLSYRTQEITHSQLGSVSAPWQFRNCGMGGRHTEKEYPESNISMQEAMFLIIGAHDYQDAQEMTVQLQNRLKEIIEKAEGCRVMGIGLEGGLAPYIERGPYPLPEIRLWAMMKQAIEECGFRPGTDVAIALDPAMSELEIAYRHEFKIPDSVGMYLFWRDKAQTVMDREEVLGLYMRAIQEHDIPILSIEDGFAEDDFDGWQKLQAKLGDRIFVIGDDLVTTNDATISTAVSKGLINTVLIKANQIGSLYETMLAMLVALGSGMEIVVSHRSKSPNDDMEAQIALAVNALGLKAGGGANTERLIKYHAITELLQRRADAERHETMSSARHALIGTIYAYEEPTNAGIPTVGATVEMSMLEAGVSLKFRGATPLGTSAGTGEAIHLVDAVFEKAEYPEIIERHPGLFTEHEPGVFSFVEDIDESRIKEKRDDELLKLFQRAQRYDGKGCQTAVENVETFISPAFAGKDAAELTLKEVDRKLLALELQVANRRGKIHETSPLHTRQSMMQRKQNIGMNAILSVSLAMARGLAHLKGKDLYEILREEMLAIIEKLARNYSVRISGSQFSDYVAALLEVNRVIEGKGEELYRVLRALTGIYQEAEKKPGKDSISPTIRAAFETDVIAETPQPPASLEVRGITNEDEPLIASINEDLYLAFRDDTGISKRSEALHSYTKVKRTIARRTGRFGIFNNRILITPGHVYIPYLIGDFLAVHNVHEKGTDIAFARPYSQGKILTDEALSMELKIKGNAVDLEGELCDFDASRADPVHVVRIRDFVEHLRIINATANRSEAIYILRLLVARLSLFSFKKQLNAKNLQSEVHTLLKELMRFINSPLSERPPLLVRILVRDIASVVTRPKLIDRLWNDTIDLAEIHVSGSAIVNELRRSSHHAMGKHTLKLALAYRKYLDTGDRAELEELGFSEVALTDEKARKEDRPKYLMGRIIDDLNKLMGSSEAISRIREWQAEYASTLVRCEFGKSFDEEKDAALEGMRDGNRWVTYHHLRIIKSRILDFRQHLPTVDPIVRRLDALLDLKPDEVLFEEERAEKELLNCVERFTSDVRQSFQKGLFETLENILTAYENSEFYSAFSAICKQRKKLRTDLAKRAFPEQRLLLLELDCLLEEISYLALRQIAGEYEEKEVDFVQCLQIIRDSVNNLTHDGLHSRQLYDLTAMLLDKGKTYGEIRNIIEQIHRNYHHLVQRVISPFEKIREKVGFTEEELQAALANIQRYMHDLNNVAYFTDIAHSFIEDKQGDLPHISQTSETFSREPYDVIHLSHRDEIIQRVESEEYACNLRDLYGSKGSGLIYISYLNIPTRDGFILPTTLPQRKTCQNSAEDMDEVVVKHLRILEKDIAKRDQVGKKFGNPENPLLLAIRSGSVFSMPGILSTVLFVGMNDEIAEGLAKQDPWCAYDAYRRFLAVFGQAVWGVDMEYYNIVEETKQRYNVKYKYDLPWQGMKEIAEMTKKILHKEGYGGVLEEVLHNPEKQLFTAINAVFQSWDSEAAHHYREIKGISNSWQSVAIIQEMALGNRKNEEIRVGMDETKASLTGVIPRTQVSELGMRALKGDFKFSAAGDDLVGGLTKSISFRSIDELEAFLPMLNRRLRHNVAKLRRFMGTDQEVEFTVENGVLSILQSRAAEIGKNRQERAFEDPGQEAACGIGIRGSAFRGIVAFDKKDLEDLRMEDLTNRDDVDGVILLLESPAPESIPLILSADALLSAKGGSTSHAAIAINGIENRDYSAVMSAAGLHVDARKKEALIFAKNGDVHQTIRKSDIISIHGMTGNVYVGTRKTI